MKDGDSAAHLSDFMRLSLYRGRYKSFGPTRGWLVTPFPLPDGRSYEEKHGPFANDDIFPDDGTVAERLAPYLAKDKELHKDLELNTQEAYKVLKGEA